MFTEHHGCFWRSGVFWGLHPMVQRCWRGCAAGPASVVGEVALISLLGDPSLGVQAPKNEGSVPAVWGCGPRKLREELT